MRTWESLHGLEEVPDRGCNQLSRCQGPGKDSVSSQQKKFRRWTWYVDTGPAIGGGCYQWSVQGRMQFSWGQSLCWAPKSRDKRNHPGTQDMCHFLCLMISCIFPDELLSVLLSPCLKEVLWLSYCLTDTTKIWHTVEKLFALTASELWNAAKSFPSRH